MKSFDAETELNRGKQSWKYIEQFLHVLIFVWLMEMYLLFITSWPNFSTFRVFLNFLN